MHMVFVYVIFTHAHKHIRVYINLYIDRCLRVCVKKNKGRGERTPSFVGIWPKMSKREGESERGAHNRRSPAMVLRVS